MSTLPEFIKGIATAKDNVSIAQRREFVRLTLGIKSNGRHIQYSVNKVDTI